MPKDPENSIEHGLSTPVDELLTSAMERGDESLETGRYIITFREDAIDAGIQALAADMQVVNARDFTDQVVSVDSVGDADALIFPELGAAVLSGPAVATRGMTVQDDFAADSPIEAIEPEYFAFVDQVTAEPAVPVAPGRDDGVTEYLRGFVQAAEVIAREFQNTAGHAVIEDEQQALVLGATWGLTACRVPQSARTGAGIKVAVLDTGMDLRHPDFAGRQIVSQTFAGQPVQDLHSHGTHCIGTAWAQGAARQYAPIRRRLPDAHLCRQSLVELRLGNYGRHTRRDQLGDCEPVRGDFDVTRLAIASAGGIHCGGTGCAQQWAVDRGGCRKLPRPNRCAGQLADDHVGGVPGPKPCAFIVLQLWEG